MYCAAAADSPVFPISRAQVSSPPEPLAACDSWSGRICSARSWAAACRPVRGGTSTGAHVLAHLVLGATGPVLFPCGGDFVSFLTYIRLKWVASWPPAISCTSSQFREIPGGLLILRPLPDSDVQVLLLFVRIERS